MSSSLNPLHCTLSGSYFIAPSLEQTSLRQLRCTSPTRLIACLPLASANFKAFSKLCISLQDAPSRSERLKPIPFSYLSWTVEPASVPIYAKAQATRANFGSQAAPPPLHPCPSWFTSTLPFLTSPLSLVLRRTRPYSVYTICDQGHERTRPLQCRRNRQ